jgi:hypothetical protein
MSAIDPTVPVFGMPTTASVRENFQIAHDEMEAVEAAILRLEGEVLDRLPFIGGTMTGPLILAAYPLDPMEATPRSYVEASIADLVPEAPFDDDAYGRRYNSWAAVLRLSGGTMRGPLMLAADPLDPMEAATRGYVGTSIANLVPEAPADGATYGRQNKDWAAALPLIGGTLTGPLILAGDPTENSHAATKQYVDNALATGLAYQGTWSVAANDPDLTTIAVQGGFRWLCVTADPAISETPPVDIDGLTGKSISDGDFILWDAQVRQFALIAAGGLTKADADSLYLSLGGGTITGPLTLPDAPMFALHAATKGYVDGFLPLIGGMLSGGIGFGSNLATAPGDFSRQLNLWGGSYGISVTSSRLNIVTGAGSTVHVIGGVDIASFTTAGLAMMAGRAITLAADPTVPLQAATKQYVDAAAWKEAPSDTFPYGRRNLAWERVPSITILGNVGFDADNVPVGTVGFYSLTNQTGHANLPPGINTGFFINGHNANTQWRDQLWMGPGYDYDPAPLWFRTSTGGSGWNRWCKVITDAGGVITGALTTGALTVRGGIETTAGVSAVGQVNSPPAPTAGTHLTNKTYVDAADALALPLIGGTMTGGLSMGTRTVPTVGDLTQHLMMHTVGYGFNVMNGRLNTVVPPGGNFVITVGGADYLTVNPTGISTTSAITLPGNPNQPLQVTTKQYVDAGDLLALPRAGGTMSGPLMLAGDPTENFHAATKQYVDNSLATGLPYQGTWSVAANDPDLTTIAMQGGFRWLCVTADPAISETPPVDIDGLTGKSISDGDFILWDAQVRQFALIASGGLTKADADTLYLSQDGGMLRNGLEFRSILAPAVNDFSRHLDLYGSILGLTVTGGRLNLVTNGTVAMCVAATDIAIFSGPGLTMMGGRSVILSGDPTAPMHAATKQYVDANDALSLPLTGGALSGGLGFGAVVASSVTDITRHIALFGLQYGINVTGNRLNLVTPASGTTNFVSGGLDVLSVSPAGVATIGTAAQNRLVITPGAAAANNVSIGASGTGSIALTSPVLVASSLVATSSIQAQTTLTSGTIGGTVAGIAVQGAAGNLRSLSFNSGAVRRWIIAANSTSESGGNAGSDLDIYNYDDAGIGIPGPALRIMRATSAARFVGSISAFNAAPPATKPVVSGAKGGNTALASLLAALVSYGLITDGTSA